MDLSHFGCLTAKASSGSFQRSLGSEESLAERPEPPLQLQRTQDLVDEFVEAFDFLFCLMYFFAQLCRQENIVL